MATELVDLVPRSQLLETEQKLAASTAENAVLAAQLELANQRYERMLEQIRLAQAQRFGPSSEKTKGGQDGQPGLFDEAEAILAELPASAIPEPTAQTLPRQDATRNKRLVQVADLPIEEVLHEIEAGACFCAKCSGALHAMGSEQRDVLEFEPARFKIVRHIRTKYACRSCEKEGERTAPVLAPLGAPLLPGSMASPSVLGYVMSQKYELAVPLYRLEQYFLGRGLEISRQTLANWVLASAKWFKPFYRHLRELLVQQDILHADETTVQVLHEKDRAPETKSYMWVYCTGREGPPLVLYDYRPTREAEHPKRFLEGFKGTLHADGYQVYDGLAGVRVAGCWAHARREFDEALKAMGLPQAAKIRTPAYRGLEYCNALFAIERKAAKEAKERGKELDAAERLAYRQAKSAPLLEEFHTWLLAQSTTVLPKSAQGQAIGYCLNQWDKLKTFLSDGRLEIDNNRCERAVKPFVIGRKNWLFANTSQGAEASAIIYSLVETAKANGLVPQTYLKYLLERLPDIAASNITAKDKTGFDALLPWTPEVQAACGKLAARK